MGLKNLQGLVSVVIPIYNAEMYLRRCIKSVLRQTYKDLEVILVDDGSSDKSLKICDMFARRDKRIKVIHQENAGVSAARNLGIQNCTGGVLTFVDADDWLPPKAIETLYEKMTETHADFVCGNFTAVHTFFYAKKKSEWKENVFEMSDKKAFDDFLPLIFFTPWAKLYRRDIVTENSLLFRGWMKVGEDTDFVLRYLRFCNSIATVSSNLYFWSILPKRSGSRQGYIEELNKYSALNCRQRFMLFDKEELPVKEQISLIINFFYKTIWHYVDEAPEKFMAVRDIRKTYELFEDMLASLNEEQLLQTEKEGDIVRFYRYKPLFVEGRYEEIYEQIRAEIRSEKKSNLGIKKKIADLIRPLSCFLVYRLGLFYHK